MTDNLNSTQPPYGGEEESSVTFAQLWGMFWNHKRWYFVSAVLCVAFAAVSLYRTPVQYSRTAKILVDESSQDATLRNLGVASAGMMRMRSTNSIENEVETFASPDLMVEVVERLGLETRYYEKQFLRTVEFYKDSPVTMTLAGANPNGGFSLRLDKAGEDGIRLSKFRFMDEEPDDVVEGKLGDTLRTPVGALVFAGNPGFGELDNQMAISWRNPMLTAKAYGAKMNIGLSGKESSVLVLSLQDQYPSRADAVLNTLLDVYNELWLRNKNRSSINTSEFINERLAVIERELGAVEKSLKEYKESNNLTDLKTVAQVQIEEASTYAAKLFEVTNHLSVANYIKDYLNDPKNAMTLIPSNVGLDKGAVDNQIKEYNELLIQRDRLISGSSVNNPLVMDMTTALESMRGAILRSIDNLIVSLDIQKEKIESQEKQIMTNMSASTDKEFQLLSIERDQKIKQELYVFLLQKREENELAALVNVGNTRMIMNPNGSPYPVSPRKMMILFAALVFGFGLPFAFFFLAGMLDRRIRKREDLGNCSLPFLAEIPHYGETVPALKRYLRIRDKNVSGPYGIIVEGGKRDLMNEAYRVLRTNVDMMLGKKTGAGRVIMLTSFLPNSGKSVTIKNLAASMSLKDAKVLLVDLDLRKASLSKSLGLHHSGAAAYLSGKSDDFLGLCDEVMPGLKVLPVGSLPPNPSELLLSGRFEQLIAQARAEFDYVFLDCPPVEVVVDARIITEYADMTAFIIRAEQMTRDVLPVLETMYQKNTYKHMALILNDVQLEYKKYGYGKSGYGYGYGN